MARVSINANKSRETHIDPDRIRATEKFEIGEHVRAYGREGRVRRIDRRHGNITIAFGKRTDDYAADIVEKIEKKK